MAKATKPHPITTILGFAVLTAAAGTTLGWPNTTHAERDELARWVAPGTKVSPDVIAEGRLVRDSKAKSGWALEIKARNNSNAVEHCNMVATVTESGGEAMSRVVPPPKIVWQKREAFSLQPQTEVVKRVPVSWQLAQKLNAEAPPPTPKQAAPLGDTGKKTEKEPVPEKHVAAQAKPAAPLAVPTPPLLVRRTTFSSLQVSLSSAS